MSTDNSSDLQLEAPSKKWGEYLAAIRQVKEYSEADKAALTWLIGYGGKALEKPSLRSLSDLIGYSHTVLQRLFLGTYKADWTVPVAAISRFRARVEVPKTRGEKVPFLMTKVATLTFEAAGFAHRRRKIVQLIGIPQIGKTFAIKEFARRAGLHVVFVRCPVKPSASKILNRLCQAVGGECSGHNIEKNLKFLYQRLSPSHLIVVDEIHQILATSEISATNTIDTLREVFDESGCRMMLIGTNIWRKAIDKEDILGGWVEQTIRRGIKVILPDLIPVEDVRMVWEAQGLGDPGEFKFYIVQFAQTHGMTAYTDLLADADLAAAKTGESISWEHVKKAISILRSLGNDF